jgi:uncharacterized membrane protein
MLNQVFDREVSIVTTTYASVAWIVGLAMFAFIAPIPLSLIVSIESTVFLVAYLTVTSSVIVFGILAWIRVMSIIEIPTRKEYQRLKYDKF